MTTLELLKATRELLSDERRWTKGAFARDINDDRVASGEAAAVCWCPAGAILRLGGDSRELRLAAMDMLSRQMGSIAHFNDTHTHAEVLAVLDKAIAAEEAKA